jgi:UPF0755 protein
MSDLSILGTGDDGEPPRRRSRRRRRRVRGPLLSLLVIVVLALGAFYGGRLILHRVGSAPDYTGQAGALVYVQVHDGDTASDIGTTLVSSGVVKSSRAFRVAAEKDARSRAIQPGTYRLRKHMSGSAALALILDRTSLVGRVTVPEGLNVRQTLALLAKRTKIPLAKLTAAAASPGTLGLPSYARGHLEGFLYPTTYDVPRTATPHDVLHMMVSTANRNLDPESLAAPGLHLTPYQVVIVASLLEEEGITSDFGKIARVIDNRLAAGKPLQLDSTVNYALGRNDARVTHQQIQVDSPYNTYRHPGLPPTPICSPGMAAVDAALHPTPGPWLYFVKADRAGHSFFTDDDRAFERQKRKSQAEGVY